MSYVIYPSKNTSLKTVTKISARNMYEATLFIIQQIYISLNDKHQPMPFTFNNMLV